MVERLHRDCKVAGSHSTNSAEIEEIPPKEMTEKFTEDEVKRAVKSLKTTEAPELTKFKQNISKMDLMYYSRK